MAISGNANIPSVDAASAFMLQYGQFEAAHKQQLESLGLPKHLWQVLYKKLAAETFDIGQHVIFGDDNARTNTEASEGRAGSLTDHTLVMGQGNLDALSDVFLIDHAWTTTIEQGISELETVPGLLDRMEALTGVFEPQEKVLAMPNTESFDSAMEVNVPVVVSQTGVSEEKARELLKKTGGDIIEAIIAGNEKPGEANSGQQSIQDQIKRQLGGGDDDDDESASKPAEWRTRKYDCSQYMLDPSSGKLDGIDIRVPVGPSVSASDIKCTFAPRHLKVTVGGNEVLDGNLHAAISVDEATWTVEGGMLVVSLVKEAAEYWPEALVGETHINPFVHSKHLLRVFSDLWHYFQGYDFIAQNADQSIVKRTNWYIQDEVGLSISHSSDPNVRCLPLLYLDPHGQMTPFSIMWPIKTIQEGEAFTRDYCPLWLKDANQRHGYLQAIFPEPTQFALDAFERMRESWVQTAKNAVRANLTSLPVPKHQIKNVFVQGASPDAEQAIKEAGLVLVESAGDADVVFDDVPHGSKQSNQHPLNSVFFSTENTIMAFQGIIGMQSWLRPGYHLKSQICEFIGAALMDSNSWWLLTNDQAIPNVRSQKIITNNWATAVRHIDVGYTSALKCTPSAISADQLHAAEKIVLLTPDNGLYVWAKNTWLYATPIQQRDNKPEPYQIEAEESEISESAFAHHLDTKLGPGTFGQFGQEMEDIIADIIRMMLSIDSSDGCNFGVFSFRFAFTASEDTGALKPCVQQITPVSVSERLALDKAFVPAIAAVLAGNPDGGLWRQIKPE